jgi:sec-independent protein translocase protein TatA
MFGMPGGSEMIIVLIVVLLLFGNRLPNVMRNMGRGIVEFKKGVKGIEDEFEGAKREVDEKTRD